MQSRTSLATSDQDLDFQLPSRKLSPRIVNQAFKRDVGAMNEDGLGETILGDTGTLIQLPSLKNIIWEAPIEWLTPNPDQPRSYFDPKKMRELRQTISGEGQKEAIKVVPYVTDTQEIKFFIVDGERRFRILNELGFETADILVGDQKTLDEVFDISLILNISRAQHNPVEIARAFGRRVAAYEKDPNRDPNKSSVQLVAEKYGVSEASVYAHLRLLKLPAKILKLIERGDLPMSSALALLKNKFKKKGDGNEAEEFRLQQVARILVDQIQSGQFDDDREDKPSHKGRPQSGRITHQMIQEANRQALVGQGRAVDALKLETASQLLKALGHLAGLEGKLKELLTEEKSALTVAGHRSMGLKKPAEVIRDQILEVRVMLDDWLDLAEEATKPPLLVLPKGKPSFAQHISKRSRNFGNKARLDLAKALAKSSDDDGKVMTWAELSERLGRPEQDIIGNFNLLRLELDAQGLDLQNFRVRRKGPRGHYEIIAAYRLSWKDARHLNSLEPETLNIKAPDPRKLDRLDSSQHALECHPKKGYVQTGFEICGIVDEVVNASQGRYEFVPVRGNMISIEVFPFKNRPDVVEVGSNIKNFSLNFGFLEARILEVAQKHLPRVNSVVLKDIVRKEDLASAQKAPTK